MQQFSASALRRSARVYAWLVAAAFGLAGCKKEEISTYTAPKEAAPPPAAANVPMVRPATAPIHWTMPAGWEELLAGGMRVGSFAVNKDGQKAEVSVIPLAGVSGGELSNVNRWRGQVGLEPIAGAKLAEVAEKAAVGSSPVFLYDMAGTDPQSKQPTRILASIFSTEGTAWFFKMTGPESLVAQQKPVFKEFLKSVQLEVGAANGPGPEPAPLMSANMKDLGVIPGHGEAAGEKPTWEVPAGWQEQPASSMRLATFAVKGENNAKADLSVVKLAGDAGGLLANVNRWRSQIGLMPVSEAELEKLVTTKDLNGVKVTLVDMAGKGVESGDSSRLVAAIVPRAGATWFYKMFGNDQLVAQQKEAFTKFVQSARYPNAP